MRTIRKRIVSDEHMQPIAVQIDYEDWLEIERLLKGDEEKSQKIDWEKYRGTLNLRVDPLTFQQDIRSEWELS